MSETYDFTPEMGEISGFGGGYEETCRMMVKAGMLWWDAHPDAKPEFKGYRNVYGLIHEENDDARSLTKAIVDGSDDCTGAMHQAVVSACLFIRAKGWSAYVEGMTRHERESPTPVVSPPRGSDPALAFAAGLAAGVIASAIEKTPDEQVPVTVTNAETAVTYDAPDEDSGGNGDL